MGSNVLNAAEKTAPVPFQMREMIRLERIIIGPRPFNLWCGISEGAATEDQLVGTQGTVTALRPRRMPRLKILAAHNTTIGYPSESTLDLLVNQRALLCGDLQGGNAVRRS